MNTKPKEITETHAYKCYCGTVHPFSYYAIAQMATGYAMKHTCHQCGRVNHLRNFEKDE